MTNGYEHLWTERHRPRSIDECILPDRISRVLTHIAATGAIPNLLLWGPPGSGKTTLARALVSHKNVHGHELNGAIDRGIDTIRNRIMPFATSASLFLKPFKVVFIDEADYLTAEMQAGLRRLMEGNGSIATFILVANDTASITAPIQSRCVTIHFRFSSAELAELRPRMVARCMHILADNNIVDVTAAEVARLVDRYFPDMRKTINQLQAEFGYRRIEVARSPAPDS